MTQNLDSTPGDPNGYNAMLDANANARLASARKILSSVFPTFSPSSVLDIGCGHGAWLQVAKELGADTIQGIDGPWIEQSELLIPSSCFSSQSLEDPLDLDQKFDLVISLEVAEHLPKTAADVFVDSVVRHGDVILFSAAIPFQGGNGHVNEQWPGYWAEKFALRGFKTLDVIRPMIWGDESVFWWLQQNTLLLLNESALQKHEHLRNDITDNLNALAMVHPFLYLRQRSAC
ncbi:MAG: methyltransferase domain-containing protein [Rhodospirillaceae bacterium]